MIPAKVVCFSLQPPNNQGIISVIAMKLIEWLIIAGADNFHAYWQGLSRHKTLASLICAPPESSIAAVLPLRADSQMYSSCRRNSAHPYGGMNEAGQCRVCSCWAGQICGVPTFVCASKTYRSERSRAGSEIENKNRKRNRYIMKFKQDNKRKTKQKIKRS